MRLTVGGLLAGHGAQKLFGAFEGHGLEGTGGFLESMGLRPGKQWAMAAGWGEFGGGVLTALGLLSPLGPIALLGPMTVAIGKVHWNKPIWAASGGAELPLINLAAGLALLFAGPGRLSLDSLFGIRLPRIVSAAAIVATGAGVAISLLASPTDTTGNESAAGAELQAESSGS
jgi:putative oxidoreductase